MNPNMEDRRRMRPRTPFPPGIPTGCFSKRELNGVALDLSVALRDKAGSILLSKKKWLFPTEFSLCRDPKNLKSDRDTLRRKSPENAYGHDLDDRYRTLWRIETKGHLTRLLLEQL
jgi:hypothetical protein